MCAEQSVLNEGRTGPFVEPPAMRKQGEGKKKAKSGGMGLGGKCQLKRWERFFYSSFPVWHLVLNGHSAAGDALAYSDGANPGGVR